MMATVAAVASPPEARVTLHGVSWRTYESLLADFVDRSVPHFTYDRGVLEIVSPGSEHERDNRTLAMLVEIVAAALSIPVDDVGSMTYKREDLQRGFEPDSSFYIQNEARVRGRVQIDPATDPPPDLVIEVDITSPSLDKFPIFAQMGVPEVWRCDQGRVSIHRLEAGSYLDSDSSGVLPPLTSNVITHLLAESRSLPRPNWFQAVSDWARAQGAAGSSPP